MLAQAPDPFWQVAPWALIFIVPALTLAFVLWLILRCIEWFISRRD